MRKIISIMLILTFIFSLTGCGNLKTIVSELEKVEQMEQEYNKENNKEDDTEYVTNTGDTFTEKDNELKQLIQQGKSIKSEIIWNGSNNGLSNIGTVMKDWSDPIGFDGYQSNGSSIQILSFLPDDCHYGQSIDINTDEEFAIDYRLNFYEDFSKINISSICLKMKGIFGVDIDKEKFQTAIDGFKDALALTTEDGLVKSYVLYDQDDINIKTAAVCQEGKKYISVTGKFANPNR